MREEVGPGWRHTPPGDGDRRGWFAGATRWSGIAVGAAAFLIAIFVTIEVIGRAALGITTAWVNDLSMYLMAFITFIGAAYALAEGAHVNVDVVLTRVKPGTRRVLVRVADAVVIAILAILTWLSAAFWWDAFTSGEQSWGLVAIRLWIPYSFLAIGMAWMLAMQIVLIIARERDTAS